MATLVSCVIKPQHVCIHNKQITIQCNVVRCRRGVWSDAVRWHRVCCLRWLPRHQDVHGSLSPLGEGIHVEGMRYPRDIVACHHDRQLYVAEPGFKTIWRVSVSDGRHSYVKWLTGLRDVWTLSLTSHHLLVMSLSPPRLRQYDTTDGQLVHEVPLPSYVEHVYHAA